MMGPGFAEAVGSALVKGIVVLVIVLFIVSALLGALAMYFISKFPLFF